ncbi:hypothetical protein [Nocardia jinanensis]|uniref:Uncharacterized protein n=1 Tax=Nocardia jinanensis TaxID=382504 RepID=A0A917RST2_9NOCA|nr:hypothetical protein [Nocardia jinanensis]GGL23750.1 hypothetical protein GCM10011588_43280 [Nocardia jinanensis]
MSAPGAGSTPGAPPPAGAEALDPTVLDLLRGSALAPMLDRPVNDILGSMGLPNLPELPAFGELPGLPPLPTIDLSALMRPLTDLASAFGTGSFGAPAAASPPARGDTAAPAPAPPVDPTQALSQISTVMQTLMQVAPSVLQAVMGLWQGMAATEAAEKAGAAQADTAELEAQSTGEKMHLAKGATSVAIGGAEMAAVIAAFSAKLALSPLYATTPGGAAFLVASAIEAATEGLVITAKTKTELGIEAVGMTQTGEKVAVTNAPTGVDPGLQIDQLMQLIGMVTPLIGTASQVAQSLGQLGIANTALSAPTPVGGEGDAAHPGRGETEKPGMPGGLGVGGVGAVGAVAAPLNAFPGTRFAAPGPLGTVGALSGVGAPGSATGLSSAANSATASSAAGSGPGVMPMGAGAGAAAGMARDGESMTDGSARGTVSAEYGDEVVGSIEGIAVPVVGAAETASEPPPDKELTL